MSMMTGYADISESIDRRNYGSGIDSKDRILELLRSSGYRITKQRELLIDILLEGSCTSGKELYLSAKERESDIGFATVYRFLGTLEKLGVISRSNMFRVINT